MIWNCMCSDLKPSEYKCKNCGDAISIGRIKYSNDKKYCTKCANVSRIACIPIINGKTGNTIQLVDQETSIRINKAMERKGQSPGAGMKGTSKLW